jgi:hypothetical protein
MNMADVKILKEAWSGPYTMVCSVMLGSVVETVSISAEPPYGRTEVFFEPDSSFKVEERDLLESVLACRYWGVDEALPHIANDDVARSTMMDDGGCLPAPSPSPPRP